MKFEKGVGRLRTLDLFHGAGGSSYGARLAGAEIIAGVDSWQIAGAAFRQNFPEATVFTEDINAISAEWLHSVIGDIDLLLASPECTNHSCAKGGAERCEKSKMTAFHVVRFARAFLPKWLVIENVIQMTSWSKHPQLLEDLWALGYYVKEEKLNAMDFGVPQSRRRLFLICTLEGEANAIASRKRRMMPASRIVDTKTNYQFSLLFAPQRAQGTIDRAERAMTALGRNEHFLIVYYGTDGSGGWQSLDKPLRTITTLDRFAYVKPTQKGHMMRMLQPEELKLAMGFNKTYKLAAGIRRDKIKLMGNAVCPPVMNSIVSAIVRK